MIDHVKLIVADLDASRRFYERALAPLGYRVLLEPASVGVGMGKEHPDFWLAAGSGGDARARPSHIAFRVETRELVDAFHAAALAAGGVDNGGPGLRPQYHPAYYGAFALDPDGNNVEAVCHAP